MRLEKNGIPDELELDQYSGIIVAGSPFDISTPEQDKSAIQKEIEADCLIGAVCEEATPYAQEILRRFVLTFSG